LHRTANRGGSEAVDRVGLNAYAPRWARREKLIYDAPAALYQAKAVKETSPDRVFSGAEFVPIRLSSLGWVKKAPTEKFWAFFDPIPFRTYQKML
jgi:hypothetical protein